MILNQSDYMEIASRVETGHWTLDYEKGSELLMLDYRYKEDGYWEDDYSNGTGAFIVTDRNLMVEKAVSFDEDGNETLNNFKTKLLLNAIES